MGKRGVNRMALVAVAAAGALSSCAEQAQREPSPAEVAGARAAADALGERLKSRLVAAMRDGGPSEAVAVCAAEAPAIAAQVSSEFDHDVSRTALRVRNTGNRPDPWEREQLERFIRLAAEGRNLAGAEVAVIENRESGPVLRYTRPILLQPQCAVCHGTDVDEGLLAEIRRLYPEDNATGFEVGDVRGIFSVERALDAD